jgi:hypothetical protein
LKSGAAARRLLISRYLTQPAPPKVSPNEPAIP